MAEKCQWRHRRFGLTRKRPPTEAACFTKEKPPLRAAWKLNLDGPPRGADRQRLLSIYDSFIAGNRNSATRSCRSFWKTRVRAAQKQRVPFAPPPGSGRVVLSSGEPGGNKPLICPTTKANIFYKRAGQVFLICSSSRLLRIAKGQHYCRMTISF